MNDAFQSACKAARTAPRRRTRCSSSTSRCRTALPFIVVIAPALIGLFFGAPLIARELETGTFRLAWTQSVTRRRWLAVKLGLVGLAAMAFGGLLTWMVDWWASPIDAANQNRFGLANFGFHGVAPIGYAAFAFALGATAGVLLRRTVPAMAVDARGIRRRRASRSCTGFARTSPRPCTSPSRSSRPGVSASASGADGQCRAHPPP